jgi:hypothetical protein
LTEIRFDARLQRMKSLYRKIISAFLLIPFFMAITFCCCLENEADASEHESAEHHQHLEKSNHSEHQEHSQGEDECSCPKHLSFLAEHSIDVVPQIVSLHQSVSNLVSFPRYEVVLLSTSSLHSQGPPWKDHRDYVSIPVFLKHSNIRI